MRRSHDVLLVDNGAAADVLSGDAQRDLPGKLERCGVTTAHDLDIPASGSGPGATRRAAYAAGCT